MITLLYAVHIPPPCPLPFLAAPPDPRFEPLPLRRADPFGPNQLLCGRCGQTFHEELSPLCLCDYCPRAYHLNCLEMVGRGVYVWG